ncbi:pyruvate:ferredoxin (flavodoxin) oxidoreductase [Solemya velum gill symbiont]|uniref:pyruvate:ferredoxin (flavodoxin) oxidoreductase n=1 Tax=Solemya velum gill symbiont TaxID=2340 RepID=UPI000998B1D9|nr:pyruvate:ferredoxin (flavodoxin) oxidoreductase [Solemya velum gill symbiont]OOZ17333.1 pyruvate:ferredoxin (flavodoxin) oxidoreductase [Solemya velum gill symbiont]OOZ26889.1 pyruvate:ferredoxin (flavodoxin) oxidoreductase [Solemya velum gill symbiont]
MQTPRTMTIDGNQAVAEIAHLTNEVIAIYPITPASPMGEWADEWSSRNRKNLWGSVPRIIEMQSEGGAAGAIHGALQTGALSTTFTASQGLLLMIPNMFKIAGELSPTVIHVSARSLAIHALSIFGDHSDVMSARSTGFAFLASGCPQEAMDMALIAQAATLESRIPIVHFFDGFRTSHEVAKIEAIDKDAIRQLLNHEHIMAHRQRALSPEHPVIRGTSQNPDVYFQGRETVNTYYQAMPAITQKVMDQFAALTGRAYHLFDYVGTDDAEKVIVLMGSGAETVEETVNYLNAQGEKVGMIKVRLYRPFDATALIDALPSTTQSVAVLDRTKEPGADGEPLYKDIVTALAQHHARQMPTIIGGRYGLSSKEFTPGMVKAVFDELGKPQPKNQFTIGILDDVTHTSLEWNENYRTDACKEMFQAVFYGLGSDGTVSANKNSIKIIGETTEKYAQGYFEYDSKKSGAVTVSHIRFGDKPIKSSYLIGEGDANFVACHQPVFLARYPMLDKAANNAVFLLNTPLPPDEVWQSLPGKMQQQIIDKKIRLFCIDAYKIAEISGMGKRINTIMQTCFFSISGVLPGDVAIKAIKDAVENTYGRKGKRLIEVNFKAIDETLANLHEVDTPNQTEATFELVETVPDSAPEFVQQVTGEIIAGRGDQIPVSQFPVDGTYPLGTAAFEKRNIAHEIPVLDENLCSQCGKCPLVCPHGVIRSKVFDEKLLDKAPQSFKSMPIKGKDFATEMHMTYQVAPEDCTGCGLCVEICPIHDKANASHKAINMVPYTAELREQERVNWDYFLTLPEYDRTMIKTNTIKGSQILQPLFEFSGACVGCGETPYVKLASQLFGDRMLVANATGCSSIYGGNLPTTPWTTNSEGRGTAWSNSLFEDNAEFGLGMRLAIDKQKEYARELLNEMKSDIGDELVEQLLDADESSESGIKQQRERIDALRDKLKQMDSPAAHDLESVAENLARKSVWIMGGDGWAYDIGYGGLDHVLATGMDVNILVLDTEVYSNTGGQTSKATPRGAVAKFSAGGRASTKKDLALLAMDYEHVYIARVAYGAKDIQTIHAFNEAEAYPGPSLIIAYSPCIAHGIDLKNNHQQQKLAVNSGHWPLFRYNPQQAAAGNNPLRLDSKPPSIPYRDFIETEIRFSMLWRTHPEEAEKFLEQSQEEVKRRYHYYEQLASLEWDETGDVEPPHRKLKAEAEKTKEQSS